MEANIRKESIRKSKIKEICSSFFDFSILKKPDILLLSMTYIFWSGKSPITEALKIAFNKAELYRLEMFHLKRIALKYLNIRHFRLFSSSFMTWNKLLKKKMTNALN